MSNDFDKLTLEDIKSELATVGRFTRRAKQKKDVKNTLTPIESLALDMEIEGKVKNIASFGAFVNIGAQQDGLIHISKLSNEFIKDPTQIVSIGDPIKVKIIGLDIERKRISLSCEDLKKNKKNASNIDSTPKKEKISQTQGRTTIPNKRPQNKRKSTAHSSRKNYSMDDLVNKFNINQ